jgi:hypothetical protein
MAQNIEYINDTNDTNDDIKYDINEDRRDDEESTDVNIFRYKFSNDFTEPLYQFSKIHQYDHRKDFKEAWKIWIEENEDLVNKEVRRLIELSYKGDILDKMFKSARYYFRKKSTEKKDPKKRRVYVGIQSELLAAMDNHISSNKKNEEYKPSNGFDDFCKQHIELLKVEIGNLCKSGIKDSEEIKNKIKKTYKNRYFMSTTKLS